LALSHLMVGFPRKQIMILRKFIELGGAEGAKNNSTL